MDRTELQIEDGTILNFNYREHKRAKNWVAIVERDKSQPGGLRRSFLDRAPGGRVFCSGIHPGNWLEFAGDYYTGGGSKQANRGYCQVIEIGESLIMEECSLAEVGKKTEAVPINPLATYTTEQLTAELSRRQSVQPTK